MGIGAANAEGSLPSDAVACASNAIFAFAVARGMLVGLHQ
jgi:hypothetical protein